MDKQQRIEQVGKIYDQLTQLQKEFFQFWYDNTFLHYNWWISLGLTVGPWLIWYLFRKKESTDRLLYGGFFVIIITCWFDFLGTSAGFWYYTGALVPTMPAYVPFDMCLFPVLVMLMIQWRPGISAWIKSVAFGIISAFIAEPLFSYIGFYVPVRWRYICSFPIYIVIYLIAHWLSSRNSFSEIQSDGK